MTETPNPLVLPILALLKDATEDISEHRLMTKLADSLNKILIPSDLAPLALFQKHFLVMNALYQLQCQLVEEGLWLNISPLAIGFRLSAEGDSSELSDALVDQVLADYYLDWNNFSTMTAEGVEALLKSFWQGYIVQDKQLEAYQVLGVTVGSDRYSVRAAYRRLAAEHHPDRGGDTKMFMQVREAYEVLSKVQSSD